MVNTLWVSEKLNSGPEPFLTECCRPSFADPLFWSHVVESLHTLTPGVYIDAQCIDFNLTDALDEREDPCMHVVVHVEGARRFPIGK